MKYDVLLVIDCGPRELVGCLLIKHFLERLGVKAYICSRFNLAQAYNQIRPSVVVVPNATFHLLDEIHPQTYVFLLPSESGSGSRKAIASNFAGVTCRPSAVDRVICWGPKMAEWLEEDGTYPREKLIVTGHPSMDHHLVKHGKKIKTKSVSIGITTTAFRMLNSSQGIVQNPFKWLYIEERSQDLGTYFDRPNHAENWVFYETAFARLLGDLVEELSIRSGWPIKIRPHPFEVPKVYDFFVNLAGAKVIVDKSGTITDWLQGVSVLLTHLSASSLDAAIFGTPVINLKKIINQTALSGMPRRLLEMHFEDFFWQPENMAELTALCRSAQAGTLAVSPNEEELKAFIYDHFFIPREKSSSLLVAEAIADVVKNKSKKGHFRLIGPEQPVPFYRKMLRNYIPNIDLVWFYLYSRRPGNVNIEFSYLPWRLKENRKDADSTARILQSIGEERQ